MGGKGKLNIYMRGETTASPTLKIESSINVSEARTGGKKTILLLRVWHAMN